MELNDINSFLSQPNAVSRDTHTFLDLAMKFIYAFEEKDRDFGEDSKSDELRPILALVGDSTAKFSVEIELVMAKVLKILLRKKSNRDALQKSGVVSLIRCLNRLSLMKRIEPAAEMCNVILNACYDGANVQYFIESEGIKPLSSFIKSINTQLQSCAVGAIQGLCYVPIGRQSVRNDPNITAILVSLLTKEDLVVRTRAIGAIHNLSVDIVSINPLRETGCIPTLVTLLRDSSLEICAASAGTLQNLARDPTTRDELMANGAVDYLSDLLFSSDVPCQIAAIGTMLNVIGPIVPEEEKGALNQALTDGLVLGALRSCLFDSTPQI